MLKPALVLLLGSLAAPVWAQNAVKVRVLDAANAPVAGASVELQVWSDRLKPFPAQITDKSGAVTLDVPSTASGERAKGGVCVAAQGFAFGSATVGADSVEVHLLPGKILRGKLSDEAGKPVADAKIRVTGSRDVANRSNSQRVFGAKNSARYTATSGKDGAFEMADVPTEMGLDYQVEAPSYALKQGYSAPASEFAELKLAPGGALRGRLLNLAGQPLPNVGVYASPVPRGFGGNQGTSDADGNFQIGSLAPGIYQVSVYDLDEAQFVVPRATGIAVEAGQTAQAPAMQAVKGVAIRGLLRDAATQKPLPAASVFATQGDDRLASVTSDAQGRFSLRVVPGSYEIAVSGLPDGYARVQPAKTVKVGAQNAEKGIEIGFDFKPKQPLRGLMVDEAGHPLRAKIRVDSYFSPTELFIESDATGQWQFQGGDEYQQPKPLQLGGGDAPDGYYEVVSPHSIAVGTTGETKIVLRRKPWQTVAARARSLDGQPLAGVNVEAEYYTAIGEGRGPLQTTKVTAISDANGDFVLPHVRDGIINENFWKIAGKKDGFLFQSGGEASKNGAAWRLSDLIFVPLSGAIEGTTAPGARVTAAGREIVTGADGKFRFEALPPTVNQVSALKDGQFGSAKSGEKIRLELRAQGLQARDEELARDIWNDLARDATGDAGKNYYRLEEVQAQLAATTQTFAQQAQAARGDMALLMLSERWDGQGAGNAAALESALVQVTNPEMRLYALLSAAVKSGDAKLSAHALQNAKTAFATPERDAWMREMSLYRAAALASKIEGDAAGFPMLDEAIAFTLKNHGVKSTVDDNTGRSQTGRDEAMALGAELVAPGGGALLKRLLENIEPNSGWDVKARGAAIPILAQTNLESALLLLDELEKLPEPPQTDTNQRSDLSPSYAFAQAATKIVPLLGAKSPEKALQLARRVHNGGRFSSDWPTRALAKAAALQNREVAARLWREIGRSLDAETGPRVAAQAFDFDPQLGRELFAQVQKKVEEQAASGYLRPESWSRFTFYFARADAAQSRYIVEREWGLAIQKKGETAALGGLAFAMSALDGERAWQMAREIPADDRFTSLESRRIIGLFLSAPEAKRRDYPFNADPSRFRGDDD